VSFGELLDWFGETPDVTTRVLEHLQLSYFPVLLAALVALPAGLYIGHTRRFQFAVVSLANLGRAVPSFAILSIFLPISIQLNLGLGFWPTVAALFFLSIPPILTNSYIGVRDVDADTVEAAKGMGMTGFQVLRRIELPLAAPLIVAGIRTAAVQSVATATLAVLVAGGGLGNFIRLGFNTGDDVTLVAGALLVALLAIITELALGLVERGVRPRAAGRHRPSRTDIEARPAIGEIS
jgi:osmoprotectant transport system permease protein